MEAAIKGGADAIYFGCAAGLNARARATNFGEEELPALMARLHEAGLEGYMCVNVLIYEQEMAQAEQLARTAEAAGVDGLIVQVVLGRQSPHVMHMHMHMRLCMHLCMQ